MERSNRLIHEIVNSTIPLKHSTLFFHLSGWIFTYLEFPSKFDKITIPYYSETAVREFQSYLNLFITTYKVLEKKEVTEFDDSMVLFDVFNYNQYSDRIDLNKTLLHYVKDHKEIILWEENTQTTRKEFLPIFRREQIHCKDDLDRIRNSFKLFKTFREKKILPFPVEINLDKDILCLSVINGMFEYINIENVNFENFKDKKLLAEFLTEDWTKHIRNTFKISVPYHRNISNWFDRIGEHVLEFNFQSRLHYVNIRDKDIILVPADLGNSIFPDVNFEIFNSEHSRKLFDLLQDLSREWKELDLNVFLYPYPKYWFTFINKIRTAEEWLELFISDYPQIANKPIINLIEKIIEEIWELNWIEKFLQEKEEVTFIFPEKRSVRYSKLARRYNEFKEYCFSIQSNVKFTETIDKCLNKENCYFVDCYNILEIIDIYNFHKVKLLSPDFIYFNYQPWIKYHILNFIINPQTNLARKSYDKDYIENSVRIGEFKTRLIEEIKLDLHNYQSQYTSSEVYDEIEGLENLVLSDDEEYASNLNNESKDDISHQIVILDKKDKEVRLNSDDWVYILRDNVVKGYSRNLEKGDFFFEYTELKKLPSSQFFDKISEIPSNIKDFQYQLNLVDNPFEKLKKLGVSYSDKKYFERTYVLDKEEINSSSFVIPRRKEDWRLISTILSISEVDSDVAFIAYYGRQKKKVLVQLYKDILTEIIKEGSFGLSDSKSLHQRINNLIDKSGIISENDLENNIDLAKIMINNILNNIEFHEVVSLKKIL